MSELLTAISAVLTALAGLIAASVALMRYRADRADGDARTDARTRRAYTLLTRPASVLVIGAALVLVSVLLLGQLRDNASGDDRRTSNRLLRALVSDQTTGCRAADTSAGETAALSCSLRKPMRRLRIALFGSKDSVKRREAARRKELNLAEGSCDTQTIAWDPYKNGILMCDYGDAQVPARLEWSRYDSNVFITADAMPRTSAETIYNWWINERNGVPSNNRVDYPDRLENYILKRSSLNRRECRRRTAYADAAATLVCKHGGADHLLIAYYAKESSLRKSLFYSPTEGNCLNSNTYAPSRDEYRIKGAVVGRRHCVIDSERNISSVEWYNTNSRLYAFARRNTASPNTLDSLFRWWTRTGRRLID